MRLAPGFTAVGGSTILESSEMEATGTGTGSPDRLRIQIPSTSGITIAIHFRSEGMFLPVDKVRRRPPNENLACSERPKFRTAAARDRGFPSSAVKQAERIAGLPPHSPMGNTDGSPAV